VCRPPTPEPVDSPPATADLFAKDVCPVGVQLVVRFPDDEPAFEAVTGKLTAAGESAVVRMIDGLPALPDEQPGEHWREVRVSLSGGMVTVRRGKRDWSFVVWGNSGDDLIRGRDLFAWAAADAGGGVVLAEDGTPIPAEQFLAQPR
jgi:hypothetical protein